MFNPRRFLRCHGDPVCHHDRLHGLQVSLLAALASLAAPSLSLFLLPLHLSFAFAFLLWWPVSLEVKGNPSCEPVEFEEGTASLSLFHDVTESEPKLLAS